jgi:hypothetical protein
MGETKIVLTPWGIVRNKEEVNASFCLCTTPVTDNRFFFSSSSHTHNALSILWREV